MGNLQGNQAREDGVPLGGLTAVECLGCGGTGSVVACVRVIPGNWCNPPECIEEDVDCPLCDGQGAVYREFDRELHDEMVEDIEYAATLRSIGESKKAKHVLERWEERASEEASKRYLDDEPCYGEWR